MKAHGWSLTTDNQSNVQNFSDLEMSLSHKISPVQILPSPNFQVNVKCINLTANEKYNYFLSVTILDQWQYNP